MKSLLTEVKRMQQLAGLITEAVEVPSWLAGKLEDVHVKPGQGSIFAKSIADVLKLAQDALDKEQDIDKIANSTGTLTIKSPGIGYNLVLPIDKAKALPGAKESEVEKVEGTNKIKVPAITTNAPLTQFKTDDLTVIVRPKKDESGTIIPNEYIVLSAFPGDPSIPRASEWGGKYAVIIPDSKEEVNEDIEDWGNEIDDYNNSEEDYKAKPDLADFDNDEEAYKKYMAANFPNEKIDLQELQYFHNGVDTNQIINYDDSDITDDLESFGQGSMDGQDFKSGETYNIGGQEYKIEPKGDEFKLVLIESLLDLVKEMFIFEYDPQTEKALANKAKSTGISKTILKSVYAKGLGAWKTGHRPGAGQHQWAMARVNSFVTGKGGARKADKTLWKKASKSKKKK